MNNYVVMICKVPVVSFLIIPVRSFMQVLWKDKSKPNHHKCVFTKFQIMSICCDFFCLSEWNILETKRPIIIHFIFYYFQSLSKKFEFISKLRIKSRNLREGIFAFIIIFREFFQLKNFQAHFLQKSRSTLCVLEIFPNSMYC